MIALTIETMNKGMKAYLPVEAQELYVKAYNKAIADGYEDEWVEAAADLALRSQYEPPRGLWVRRTK
ncbi:ChaB [compost metagenome]